LKGNDKIKIIVEKLISEGYRVNDDGAYDFDYNGKNSIFVSYDV
jgi:hypothetical protein